MSTNRLKYIIGACWISALAVLSVPVAAASSDLTVEPPNWWTGQALNPVRLLVHGSGLRGARISPAGAGLSAGPTFVNARGTYAFVSVRVASDARPGAYLLRVQTSGGVRTVRFPVLRPLARRGRFAGFSPDDVIYLIMPDRFCDGDPSNNDPPKSRGLYDPKQTRYYHGGDLQGVIDKLPYLKALGVTTLWLTPIYDNADRADTRTHWDGQPAIDYHGYEATDFYGVEEHFGTLDKLRQLTDRAHRLGLKVIQDQVANHTGPFHPWVSDAPTPTWFNGTAERHRSDTWQTWTLMSPHATAQTRSDTLRGWFADILPDLNQDDPEVARYLIQNSLWWLGTAGFDGIREDTVSYVPRRFWRQWTSALKRDYPHATVVGEINGPDPALVAYYQGGQRRPDGIDTGIDTLFDYPLYFALRDAFASGKPLREVPQTLAHDWLYPHPEELVTFLDLHDVPRFLSVPGATEDGLKLALTCLLTTRGVPMLYYGDEIGMRGGDDPDNRRDFPGGFPGAARDAFTAAGRTPREQAIFSHVRRLIRLRAALTPLRRGGQSDLFAADQQYVYARTLGRDAVVVALNNDAHASRLTFSLAGTPLASQASLVDRLGASAAWPVRGGQITVELPARCAAILTRPFQGRVGNRKYGP